MPAQLQERNGKFGTLQFKYFPGKISKLHTEKNEFGDKVGKAINFTEYSLRKTTKNSAVVVDGAIIKKCTC